MLKKEVYWDKNTKKVLFRTWDGDVYLKEYIPISLTGYGYLYNWYAIEKNNLAPIDWRVPDISEFVNLRDTVDPAATNWGDGKNIAGGELKAIFDWTYPNTDATDNFKFKGLGGGLRSNNFSTLRYYGFFWSTTNYGGGATYISLQYDGNYADSASNATKYQGMSVRCIQDKDEGESTGDVGTVTDIAGNIYDWVVIGDFRWMRQNLKTVKYNDGNVIPLVTDQSVWNVLYTGARCAYDNDENNVGNIF